jgi:hypothetical protein
MRQSRGSWYLLTGLIFGLILGLVYAWVISPVAYINTDPGSLRADFKGVYRALIASAYNADGNLERARVRLSLLKDANPAESLAAQAQSLLAQGGSQDDARRLAVLAAALGKAPRPVSSGVPLTLAADPSPLPVSLTPTPQASLLPSSTPDNTQAVSTVTSTPLPSTTFTRTPAATTMTPLPTVPSRTPTPTLGAPFILKSQQQICDPSLTQALLQVQVTDAAGRPVPGVEIQVTWQGGSDFFFTGLKPDLGSGYADFVMKPGESYSVHLAEGSQVVNNLNVPDCSSAGGSNYWGGWLLSFTQ